jgi:hypothetical protein
MYMLFGLTVDGAKALRKLFGLKEDEAMQLWRNYSMRSIVTSVPHQILLAYDVSC